MSIIAQVKRNKKSIVIAAAAGLAGTLVGYLTSKMNGGTLSFARSRGNGQGAWGYLDAHFPNRTKGIVTTYNRSFGSVGQDYLVEY